MSTTQAVVSQENRINPLLQAFKSACQADMVDKLGIAIPQPANGSIFRTSEKRAK